MSNENTETKEVWATVLIGVPQLTADGKHWRIRLASDESDYRYAIGLYYADGISTTVRGGARVLVPTQPTPAYLVAAQWHPHLGRIPMIYPGCELDNKGRSKILIAKSPQSQPQENNSTITTTRK
jgi:hypothetical protein